MLLKLHSGDKVTVRLDRMAEITIDHAIERDALLGFLLEFEQLRREVLRGVLVQFTA